MVRSNRSEHSADSASSRSSRRSTGSNRSTVTIKSTDTSVPKPSRRKAAFGAMIYFAGGDPRRVRAVRHNEIKTEWDDDYRYPTTSHQLCFVSAKYDGYYGWGGYDEVYEPAPRRSPSRRSNPVPVHNPHQGGMGPRPPMGGPPGPPMMGRDDDYSSSSGSDDDEYSDDSAEEYGHPVPPPHMHVGAEFGDAPFMGGPHPGMMHPQMMHPQGHFAGPPQAPPQQGGDAPAFFKLN